VALGLTGIEADLPERAVRRALRGGGEARPPRDGPRRRARRAGGDRRGARPLRRRAHRPRRARVEDEGLIDRLRRERIPLEVCPTSNVCLGLYPDVAHHAFDRLRRAGVEVTVNTDDPALLRHHDDPRAAEAPRRLRLHADDLAGFTLAAVRHSFLPAAEKEALAARLRAEIAEAAERHLGRPVEIGAAPASG
jgi:hypothetical protein